jgi:hypothetical protein
MDDSLCLSQITTATSLVILSLFPGKYQNTLCETVEKRRNKNRWADDYS